MVCERSWWHTRRSWAVSLSRQGERPFGIGQQIRQRPHRIRGGAGSQRRPWPVRRVVRPGLTEVRGQRPLALDVHRPALDKPRLVRQHRVRLHADLRAPGDPGALHAGGHVHCVSPQVVRKLALPDDPRHHRPHVHAHPHAHTPPLQGAPRGDAVQPVRDGQHAGERRGRGRGVVREPDGHVAVPDRLDLLHPEVLADL